MSKAKVLLVDDEAFNLDFFQQALEDENYEIFIAADGQEALNKIKSEKPDLVLLDLMMPVLDGFEVLKQVKADDNLRDTPIIIISAEHDSKSVVKGIKQGAEDYMTKPITAANLLKKVKEYLG